MLKVNYTSIIGHFTKVKKTKEKVMPKAYDYFKSITPIRSGNARRNTRLDNKNNIEANYDYASRLDEGWSKQAPKGMTKPTEKKIEELVKAYIKSLGT
jgi:hypothetical protein